MAKSNLESAIGRAAADFALVVVEAVKSATLQELIALQQDGVFPAHFDQVEQDRTADYATADDYYSCLGFHCLSSSN